jgi:hypothetical protein
MFRERALIPIRDPDLASGCGAFWLIAASRIPKGRLLLIRDDEL